MSNENETEITDVEEHEEKPSRGIKNSIYRYRIPIALIVIFVIAAIITNTINASISGAMLSSVSSECQENVEKLEAENKNLNSILSTEKQVLVNDNDKLKLEKANLEDDARIYSSILNGLDQEKFEARHTQFDFKATWDKYILSEPGQEFIWSAEIMNTGSTKRTYSLDLRLKSNDDKLFDKEPVAGSLTLAPGSSGELNVKLKPKDEGYVIFGLYVNNNYVGDFIVFSL